MLVRIRANPHFKICNKTYSVTHNDHDHSDIDDNEDDDNDDGDGDGGDCSSHVSKNCQHYHHNFYHINIAAMFVW